MIAPPDLNDPVQRAAYQRELRGVARPLRHTAVSFALLGVALAIVRRQWFPDMPAIVPVAALALGVLNMVAGVVIRTRYHQARMRG